MESDSSYFDPDTDLDYVEPNQSQEQDYHEPNSDEDSSIDLNWTPFGAITD